jgi:drug/metabolite transporter (DMT)-like permease
VTLVLWASAFVAIRYLGDDFSPGALSLGRLLVGSLALAPLVWRRGWVRPASGDWWRLVAIGALWYGVYNVALNEGEHHVDAGTAAMLIQVSPILIAVLAAAFLGERFTWRLAAGLALAFSGVVLIATAGEGGSDQDVLGVALCLLSALVYSISLILQKPLTARLPAVQITWAACTIGAICCLPFAGRLLDEATAAPGASLGWVAYLGVFPTAIAFTTYAFALRHMSASSLGVTTYLVPPITIVLGLVFLGEAPPVLAYAGGALALVGVWFARRRPRRDRA